MIKGCRKSIIYIKDTKSPLFEEAYLVLRPDAEGHGTTDVIKEANKIIGAAYESGHGIKRKRRGGCTFLSGAIFASFIFLLAFAIDYFLPIC